MPADDNNYLLDLLLTFDSKPLPFINAGSRIYTRDRMIDENRDVDILSEYPTDLWFIHDSDSNWDSYLPIHGDDDFPFAIINDYLNGNGYIDKTYLINAILSTSSSEILNTGYILYRTDVLLDVVNLVIDSLKDDEINHKQFYSGIKDMVMKHAAYPYWIWYNQYTIRPIKTDADLFDIFRGYIAELFPDE